MSCPGQGAWECLAMFERFKRRAAERRSHIELSHMDPYLLRDIGLQPGDLRDPFDGPHMPGLLTPFRRRPR